ncbi:MAG: DNA polymerase III subunit gamma/tau, partial [Alphaproteobacteria bacterium]
EIRKVPITVQSRCQRFDLRRIDAGLMVEHLRKIAAREEITVEDEALAMIARAAEGSVRDALSIFDQAIAHSAGAVTAATVRDMLGLADRARVIDLFERLMQGDIAAALAEFRAQYDAGADPAAVLTDLAEFTHLVTRLRFVPEASADAALTEDERVRGPRLASDLSIRVLSRAWQMLLKGIPEVQASSRPVSAGEMVLIRMAHAADLPTLDEVLKRADDGAGPAPSGGPARGTSAPGPGAGARAVSAPVAVASSNGGATMRLAAATPEPAIQPQQPAPSEAARAEPGIASLADIAALADRNRDLAFKVLVKRCVRPVRIEPGRLEVSLTDDAPKTLLGDITSRLQQWTGRRWIVSLSRERGDDTMA